MILLNLILGVAFILTIRMFAPNLHRFQTHLIVVIYVSVLAAAVGYGNMWYLTIKYMTT